MSETRKLIEVAMTEVMEKKLDAIWNLATNSERSINELIADAAPELASLGVNESLVGAISSGFETNQWDNAVACFGEGYDSPVSFFLGPMRRAETEASNCGMILAVRDDVACESSLKLLEQIEKMEPSFFNQPLSCMGRHIEFYDIALAQGPILNDLGGAIALFTPFLFGGWEQVARQSERRRTILFSNIIRLRFMELVAPLLAANICIDSESPRIASISEIEFRRATSLWFTLHEMIHCCGPLPLFGGGGFKLGLKLAYAGIEELRVDMTAFFILNQLRPVFGDLAQRAQELIVLDRVCRSARRALRWKTDSWYGKSAEIYNGIGWLTQLMHHGAVHCTSDGRVNINWSSVGAAVDETLNWIYVGEERCRGSEDCEKALSILAKQIDEKILSRWSEKRYNKVIGNLKKMSPWTEVRVRFRY